MQQQTDKELIERYAEAGDDLAFAELVARYSPMVYRVCRRLLGNEHDAEDASQGAFVVLARKAAQLREDGRLNGWLHRVARLVALEALRKRAARERHEMECAGWTGNLAESSSEVDLEAVLSQVDTALDDLSGVLREAVVLRYLRGFSERDAAAQAGCPVGTMKRRASDGISKLRRRLAKQGVTLSDVALAGLLASEASSAVPETLLPSLLATVKGVAATSAAGTGFDSVALGAKDVATTTAGTLAQGAMRAMFIAQVKMTALVTAVVMGVGGAGVTAYVARTGGPATGRSRRSRTRTGNPQIRAYRVKGRAAARRTAGIVSYGGGPPASAARTRRATWRRSPGPKPRRTGGRKSCGSAPMTAGASGLCRRH